MSTSRILKWPVPIDDFIHEVGGGEVAFVDMQYGQVCVWTLESDDEDIPKRRVRIVGTGQEFDSQSRPLGSVQSAYFVWHLIEIAS